MAGKIEGVHGRIPRHAPPPPPHGGGAEETIEGWSIRTLGEEVYCNVIEPIVSGIFAGDPTRLSARTALPKLSQMEERAYDLGWNAFGALFYGALVIHRGAGLKKESGGIWNEADNDPPPWRASSEYGRPGSYRTGLTALPDAIMDKLAPTRVQLRWKLINFDGRRDGDADDGVVGGYAATFQAQDDDGTSVRRTVRARTLVVTIPVHAVGTMLNGVLPGLGRPARRCGFRWGGALPPCGVVHPRVSQIVLPQHRST
jgi:protoporphyrinogen oxidase